MIQRLIILAGTNNVPATPPESRKAVPVLSLAQRFLAELGKGFAPKPLDAESQKPGRPESELLGWEPIDRGDLYTGAKAKRKAMVRRVHTARGIGFSTQSRGYVCVCTYNIHTYYYGFII